MILWFKWAICLRTYDPMRVTVWHMPDDAHFKNGQNGYLAYGELTMTVATNMINPIILTFDPP